MLWFILGGLLLLLVIWVISVQNKLVSVNEFCENSLSQIGVQQQSRWDALTALADLTKNYSSFENDTLLKVISARKNMSHNVTAKDIQSQESLLSQGFASINALAEAYPDLKANAQYSSLMDELAGTENRITVARKDYNDAVKVYNQNNVRMSRMVYNDSVTKFNRLVLSFPGSMVASLLRFRKRDYLEEVTEKKEVPSFK